MSRKSYTMRELKDIVMYIVQKNAYAETKGRAFWQNYAATDRTCRTWQSLKETFLKRILPDITNPYYELTQPQVDSLRSGCNVMRRLTNKLEWHTSDSEAGPSKEIKNHLSNKDEKQQDPGVEVVVSTRAQGELADSHVCRAKGEESHSRNNLRLRSSDERGRRANEDDVNSDTTLVLDEDDQTDNTNHSHKSGRVSKLKDKLIFLEPLTPMMQEMITDSDVSNSSDSMQSTNQDNEQVQVKDASLKESEQNESMKNIDVTEENDESVKKALKPRAEKVEQVVEIKNIDSLNSKMSATKKDDCMNQKNDNTTPETQLVSNKLEASEKIPSCSQTTLSFNKVPLQTSNETANETVKDNFESRNVANDAIQIGQIEKNCVEHEIKSTTKLMNYESKSTPNNEERDKTIIDVNEIITVQKSTRVEAIHAKGSEKQSANIPGKQSAEIPSLSLNESALFLKSNSNSSHNSDGVESTHAKRTVRGADRSKSNGLAKVFGLVSGESHLKFVTSKKYSMKQSSSKAKQKHSIRKNLCFLSSRDSDSSSSDSDSNTARFADRNSRGIIQPLEVKAHGEDGMLMVLCGNHLYPLVKKVGSKRCYMKWIDDGKNEIGIVKKHKKSKNKDRGDRDNHHRHIRSSTSEESDSDEEPFHKMRRYTAERMNDKTSRRGIEKSLSQSDKLQSDLLLERQRNDKLMGMVRDLLELNNHQARIEHGQSAAPKHINKSRSPSPDVQAPAEIDLTQQDGKETDQSNVLKISISNGDKVIQMDITNSLEKVLHALQNETGVVQENQQTITESEEVQAGVDRLEENIFNTIIELDKREGNGTPNDVEKQMENNETEGNPSSESGPVVDVTIETENANVEKAILETPTHSPIKKKSEDGVTETEKVIKSPSHIEKDTIRVQSTPQESVPSALNTPETHKRKISKRSQSGRSISIVEDNDLGKNVSKEKNDVSKDTAMEHSQVTESTPQIGSSVELALDDSDQEIVFTKETMDKTSSVELRPSRTTRKNITRRPDPSANAKPEGSANAIRQSPRTRATDHERKTNLAHSTLYKTRSQNKPMNKKNATHALQDSKDGYFDSDSAHGYVDSDLSPILRSSIKHKCRRKYRVTKQKSLAYNLLPRSIRRSRQSNEFKKQLDFSKLPSHTMQKTMDTSANSTSYHTTPMGKLRVERKRVLENIPAIYVDQLDTTETAVSPHCEQNSNFENTPSSTGIMTPAAQDTPTSTCTLLSVSPEISFIEKITVSLDMLNSVSNNDLLCGTDHFLIKTIVDTKQPLLDQDISFNESEELARKQDENMDRSTGNNDQYSEESSLQDSRGYASLVSESLISGISNVNLSNKLQLSQTLETEFTNLSLEKQQNKLALNSQTSKENKVTKKDKSKSKSKCSESTRESNSTPNKPADDLLFDSNDENTSHNDKEKRGKKQCLKVKIVRPKRKSKNASKVSNISQCSNNSNNVSNQSKSSQNLSVPINDFGDLSIEEIATDPQPVICLDNDDSLLTPADPSLQLGSGAEGEICVNFSTSMQSLQG